jgi:hypothetical protein
VRFPISVVFVLATLGSTAWSKDSTQIVLLREPEGPAAHGIAQLTSALSNRGIAVQAFKELDEAKGSRVIVAGLASERPVAELITAGGLKLPDDPEALSIRRIREKGRTTVVLCGGGPVGLMYAALDTAERVGWSEDKEDPFAYVTDTSDSPCLTDRSISTYTMQRRLFEQRLYDEAYWERYFNLLAKNRINSYVIVFGYENGGFMAPIYPYFFDVEEFPDVQFHGMTKGQQAKNTKAFQRLIELAHERGIRVTVGIWDHIYRGGVQEGGAAKVLERFPEYRRNPISHALGIRADTQGDSCVLAGCLLDAEEATT